MRLNRWLALLLAALLCGVLSRVVAEEIVLDVIEVEDMIEVKDFIEVEGLIESVPVAVEALGKNELVRLEPEMIDGNPESIVPFKIYTYEERDEDGNVIGTYKSFFDDAGSMYRILKGTSVRLVLFNANAIPKTGKLVLPGKVDKYRVTEIGDFALTTMKKIRSVKISNGVKKIGQGAFSYCRGLKEVTIPDTVTEIGNYAFSECNHLTSVMIPGGATKGMKKIGQGAFLLCQELKKVTIPDTVTEIGDSAFMGCTQLTSVTIPGSVKTLGKQVFYGCKAMTKVKLNKGLKRIGASAFEKCAIATITIPKTVKEIGDEAFKNCDKLKRATISKNVTKLGKYVFAECDALTEATLEKGCTKLPDGLFNQNKSLKKVQLPAGLKRIGAFAFEECAFASVTIPDTVKEIGEKAFKNCDNLKRVTVPNSVTNLGNYAFAECDTLTEATFGEGCTKLPDGAFEKNESLEKVKLPSRLKSIGAKAFDSCAVLKIISLPEGLKTIGKYAFSECGSLKTVVIPDGVERLGDCCFYSCGLDAITIPKNTVLGWSAVSANLIRTYYDCPAEQYAKEYRIDIEYLDVPETVTLNVAGAFEMELKTTMQLTATLAPEGCAPYIYWETSDASVAPVSDKGLVEARNVGVTTITVCDANHEARASVVVTVGPKKPTNVIIALWPDRPVAGCMYLLTAVIEPADSQTKLTWSSSDTSVATVDENGNITCLAAGTVIITVATDNGLTDSVTLDVLGY